ncbi:hypothetical protein AD998_06880 [bacterium 336/3]|nr:hypothetical protein AD998_06880 [bacterium 336/3]
MKFLKNSVLFICFFIGFTQCKKEKPKEISLAELYDKATKQKPVESYEAIDKVLASFKQVNYQQLDKNYIEKAGLIPQLYAYRTFYIIKGKDVFKYLVGTFRVQDFLPDDEYAKKNLENLQAGHIQYLLLDPKLLYRFLDLLKALKSKGYKPKFKIDDGFRYPNFNDKVGGAKGSLHTHGMAVDIDIADVDGNGKTEKADKKIILDLLENTIIKDKGGVGRYPWSQTVHFDVRGWYARWDKQN